MPTNSLRNIPSLAGVCLMDDAMNPGLSVELCVERLKRYHYGLQAAPSDLHRQRLTAEPLYELKMAFSLHAHLCAEHATALRKRVGEMREPPPSASKPCRIPAWRYSSTRSSPRPPPGNLSSACVREGRAGSLPTPSNNTSPGYQPARGPPHRAALSFRVA